MPTKLPPRRDGLSSNFSKCAQPIMLSIGLTAALISSNVAPSQIENTEPPSPFNHYQPSSEPPEGPFLPDTPFSFLEETENGLKSTPDTPGPDTHKPPAIIAPKYLEKLPLAPPTKKINTLNQLDEDLFIDEIISIHETAQRLSPKNNFYNMPSTLRKKFKNTLKKSLLKTREAGGQCGHLNVVFTATPGHFTHTSYSKILFGFPPHLQKTISKSPNILSGAGASLPLTASLFDPNNKRTDPSTRSLLELYDTLPASKMNYMIEILYSDQQTYCEGIGIIPPTGFSA